MNSYVDNVNFFEGNNPEKIASEFGTPLYVYNERIIRDRMHKVNQVILKLPTKCNLGFMPSSFLNWRS